QLIALGGAIGTGLFMGSGKTISLAGPSILLVYLIIGVMLFFVMRAMGELLLSNLEYKSFIDFSTDLLGPWAGFFCGWTYWFCWIITAIADVIAIAAYTQFWFPGLAPWIPAVLCVLLLLSLNLVTVKLFGEMEFRSDRRRDRDRRLYPVLVSGAGTVDSRGAVRVAAAQPEPGDGEAVRRDGVLVRADQDHRDLRADRDRLRAGRLGLHLAERPPGVGGQSVERRRLFPEGAQRLLRRLPDRGIRLRRHRVGRHHRRRDGRPEAQPAQGDQLDPGAHHHLLRAGPGGDHGGDAVAPGGAGQEPVRGTVRAGRHPGGGQPDQLRGADLGHLLGQQRHLLHQPHAVRSGRGAARAEDVWAAVACGGAVAWPAVLVLLPAAWRGADLPDP